MEYIKVLLPSIGVALLFWYVIRSIVFVDRRERAEMDRFYEESHEAKEVVESEDAVKETASTGVDPDRDRPE